MPFCAYCVQISTTRFESSTDARVDALELDVGLDELHGAVGAGRDGLDRRAGEPVDHRAARDQAEQERRVQQRELRHQLRLEALGERHDDRENHRGRADDGRADEHGLGRRLERIAGAVVLLEIVLGAARSSTSNPYVFLSSASMFGICSIVDSSKTDCALSVTGPYESTAIVTGPMPRNPNATRPNANTAGAIMSRSENPILLTS